jgi:hypothetical protein
MSGGDRGARSPRPGPIASRRANGEHGQPARHGDATRDDGIRANGATHAQRPPASLPSRGQIHQGEGPRPAQIARTTHRQPASPIENRTQIKHSNPQVKAPCGEGPAATRRLAAPGRDQHAPGRRGQRRRRCPRATGPYKPRPARRRPAGQTARPRNRHRPAQKRTNPGSARKRPTAGPGHAKARAKTGKRAKGDHRDERRARPTPTRNGARAAPRARRRWRERKGSEKRKKKRTWQPPGRPVPGTPGRGGRPHALPSVLIIAHGAICKADKQKNPKYSTKQ